MDGSPKPMTATARSDHARTSLSVVVPMHNESGNVVPLVGEIIAALRGRSSFEIVCVDDCSGDATLDELRGLGAGVPELRIVTHARQAGQSAALHAGIKAARGEWIATMDGDGQNDPADIRRLLEARAQSPSTVRLFAGWRVDRRDTRVKRLSSKIANAVRRRLLHDDCPDTGCGLKLFARATYLDLPYFDHMHRYLPALVRRAGGQVCNVPVGHRPRTRGTSKYGIGNRLWVGIVDLIGVAWLMRRANNPPVVEIGIDTGATV
jgi:dolichol-phosphate mannosyltransferase